MPNTPRTFEQFHASRLSNGLHSRSNSPEFERKLQQLRAAVYDKDATKYFAISKALNLFTCDLCGIALDREHKGTGLCDGCWELNTRIHERDLKIWAQMTRGRERLQEVLKIVLSALNAPEPPVDS